MKMVWSDFVMISLAVVAGSNQCVVGFKQSILMRNLKCEKLLSVYLVVISITNCLTHLHLIPFHVSTRSYPSKFIFVRLKISFTSENKGKNLLKQIAYR